MRTQLARWVTSGIIVVLAGCSGGRDRGPTAAEIEAFEAAEMTLPQAYAAACNAGDADAYVALINDDFVQLSPDALPVTGKPAMYERIKAMFEAYDFEEFAIDNRKAEMFGDWGWFWGTHSYLLAPLGTTDFTRYEGKHMTMMKKQADGSWLYYGDAFNYNAPAMKLAP